jgi:hypothetical protein
MTWRTMSEWNAKGKAVVKGTKCILRDPDGNCLFSSNQVQPRKERYYVPREYNRSNGYYAQSGGNYQKHDYDYDDYDFQ